MGTRDTIRRFFVAALTLAALFATPLSAPAAQPQERPVVLVLNSYNLGYDWSDAELAGVQQVLGSSPLNPSVLVEHLDTKYFPNKTHFRRQADLLGAKFSGAVKPDVILAMDNAALEFALRFRPEIFPGKSIVFCGVNDYTPQMIAGQGRVTGVAENHDSVGTLELALRLFPKTREVLAVHDYTDTGLAMRNELSKVADRFPGLKIVSAPEQRVEQLEGQLGRLREGQLVVLLSYVVDKSGRFFTLAEAADLLSRATAVPVFAVHANQLGHGVVGGNMMEGGAQGRAAARLVEAVLGGKDPDRLPVFTGQMSAPMFDFLQLEHFGLDPEKTQLPPGSVLINTPKTFYQVNKALVWVSLLLIGILSLALVAVIINGRRQLAIRALSEANHAYRHLLDSVGDTIYIINRDGTIIEANAAAALNTGYPLDELCGMHISQLVAPEFAPLVSERLESILNQGFALFESVHITRDGRQIPMEINAQVGKFRGEPCIISINRDITMRKQTEHELRVQAVTLEQEIAERQEIGEQLCQERDNVRALFDAAPVGMMLIDDGFQIVDSNSALHRLTGKPIEQILGLEPGIAFDCRQVDSDGACGDAAECQGCRLRESVIAALGKNRSTKGIEIQHILHSGSRDHLWLRFSVEPVSFDGMRHALVAIDDVSQQRQMEAEVLAEKERLSVTLASLGEGVITSDPEGSVTLMNRAAELLTGCQRDQSLGQPLGEVFRLLRKASRLPITGLDRVQDRELVLEADGHVLLVGCDGRELHITGSTAPMRNQEQQIIGQVLVFRDNTEKHELENELFQARKLESLGVLAGGLAHDLNNLLTAIVGNISIAELKAGNDPELQPFLSRALKASERTGDLTQQLLTFAKGGAPVKKITALQNIVTDSAEFALRGSNIRCEYQIAEQLYPVAVDAGQMSQVINNLVINAKQAMPEGGILRIVLENLDRHCIGPHSRPGRYVRVQVQDQGSGISPENLERIFDPYFTTKQTGNGLGLSSVHAIVAKHDGAIKVESTLGAGTTFSFVIPASAALPEPSGCAVERSFRDSGRVLVMDDDPTIIETLSEMLQLIGYRVVRCQDGREALKLYREAAEIGDPFKLVLMDLTIPGGLGGEQATRELLREYPDAKVIVASGYSDSAVMANFAEHGFIAAIAKPYTISVVSDALRNLNLPD